MTSRQFFSDRHLRAKWRLKSRMVMSKLLGSAKSMWKNIISKLFLKTVSCNYVSRSQTTLTSFFGSISKSWKRYFLFSSPSKLCSTVFLSFMPGVLYDFRNVNQSEEKFCSLTEQGVLKLFSRSTKQTRRNVANPKKN